MRKPYLFLTSVLAAAALWLAATNPVLTQGFAGNFDTLGNLRVKIDTAIAAGTNAIGKLAANAGINIGTVDVASSALPTGAASAANQTTGNGLLSSIDGKLPSLGQALAASSVPIVLTAAQLTTLTPPAAISGFATAAHQVTQNGYLDGLEAALTTLDSRVDGIEALITATNLLLTNATASSEPVSFIDMDETVQTIDSGTSVLDMYFCSNPNDEVTYVQIFDVSGSVTLGTTVPKLTLGIPPNDSAGNLAAMNVGFANAIKTAATEEPNGATAPDVDIVCNFGKH